MHYKEVIVGARQELHIYDTCDVHDADNVGNAGEFGHSSDLCAVLGHGAFESVRRRNDESDGRVHLT